MSNPQLKFGTSGLRGPVVAFKSEDCIAYGISFVRLLKQKFPQCQKVSLAGDLRASTPMISEYFVSAMKSQGMLVENVGLVPTPVLASWALEQGHAAVMVTGSHIPADQNGVKFYTPAGEITKDDEAFISQQYQELKVLPVDIGVKGALSELPSKQAQAEEHFRKRYVDFFGANSLQGLRVAFYQHSGVGRDILPAIFKSLCAEVKCFGFSSEFIPVDTENLQNISHLQSVLKEMQAYVLCSTDGDADRPLVVDSQYGLIRGDLLGIVASQLLNIKRIATPVSSTSLIEEIQYFDQVERTKIGSPFVISGIEKLMAQGSGACAGFEANGGYIVGSSVSNERGQKLQPLLTRDCLLPMVAFAVARKQGRLQALFESFGEKANLSGLVPHFPREMSVQLIEMVKSRLAEFLAADSVLTESFAQPRSVDTTDGVKILSRQMETLHFRPSGNAPEFRVYVEANDGQRAGEFLERALGLCRGFLADH